MSIEARQPRGIPTGGQFATTTHGEAALSLQSANASQSSASVSHEEAQAQAEWVRAIRKEVPEAAFAEYHRGDEIPGLTADPAVTLYDAEGMEITDAPASVDALAVSWNQQFDVSAHHQDPRVAETFSVYNDAFSLDSVTEHWAQIQKDSAPTVPAAPEAPAKIDPFPHLSGMEKVRAQASLSSSLASSAAEGYRDYPADEVRSKAPNASRIYAERTSDSVYGIGFTLGGVTNEDGSDAGVDLSEIQNAELHDGYLEDYLVYDEDGDIYYIDLNDK